MMKNKDAIILFFKKEGQELLGKRKSNFVILLAIFLLAILSISFGSASMSYLKFKMDDPFVQWVDIIADQTSNKVDAIPVTDYLKKQDVQAHFQFVNPQENYVQSIYFRHSESGKDIQLQGRSINAGSAVLSKILDDENVVELRKGIPYGDNELGIIITEEALTRIGYERGKIPGFVHFSQPFDKETCESIGLGIGNKGYYEVAFPIVAVVKQLPGMYSFLFSDRFWNDLHANCATTWDITEDDNNQELILCGEESDLKKVMAQLEGKGLNLTIDQYNQCWEFCNCLRIADRETGYDLAARYQEIYSSLNLEGLDVERVYEFAPINDFYKGNPTYYSIQMTSLDSIRQFQADLAEKCGINLDMTTIDAKDNFRLVQRMGTTLSFCIILISVIFICVFIYFLLNTHFQKIQRNLGTFKAFGVSNKTLDSIYMSLLFLMTVAAFVISLVVSWVVSFGLDFVFTNDGGFSILDVWVWQNAVLLLMAIVASVVVTKMVSNKKLKYTPGDLIYDRTEKEEIIES